MMMMMMNSFPALTSYYT